MTIERGVDWGQPGPLPADGVLCASDAEARHVVVEARRHHRDLPTIGLVGGDLWKTLGAPPGGAARVRSENAVTFPVDLGSVLVDGRLQWFVAHLVARRSWLRGRTFVAMNAQWLGDWDLAPRGHPNDGKLDVTDGDLPFGQRLAARRRLVTGTHLPHPALEHRQVEAVQADLRPALDVYLDGEKIGRATTLSIRVEADALTVVV